METKWTATIQADYEEVVITVTGTYKAVRAVADPIYADMHMEKHFTILEAQAPKLAEDNARMREALEAIVEDPDSVDALAMCREALK
jgi:hypothetical protein